MWLKGIPPLRPWLLAKSIRAIRMDLINRFWQTTDSIQRNVLGMSIRMAEPGLGQKSAGLPAHPKKGRGHIRSLIGLAILLGSILVISEIVYIFGGGNLREVLPGRIYRSSQPNPRSLEKLIAQYHIRTIFNLRGCCEPTNWYLEEAGAAQKANISLEDYSFSAGRLPSSSVMKRLVEALDQAEEPILIHCHQGIDRTGLVAALWLLLRTQTTLDDALPQLSLRYLHLPFGRTGNLDRFLDYYSDWLREKGETHSPALLRSWLTRHYIPGGGKARLALRDPAELQIEAGKTSQIGIQCFNESLETWVFRPGNNAGVHLYWYIISPDRKMSFAGHSGLFESTVAPGASITLEVPVPANVPPGEYLLRVDMEEPWHARFVQMTGSIMEETIRVRERPKARSENNRVQGEINKSEAKQASIQGRKSP